MSPKDPSWKDHGPYRKKKGAGTHSCDVNDILACGYCGDLLLEADRVFKCIICGDGYHCIFCAEADGHFKVDSIQKYLCDECATEMPDNSSDDED